MTEHLQYHIDGKLPLSENTFRYGSKAFLDLWKEARTLYSRDILDVSGIDKEIITETKLGEYGMFEGQMVPLDLPMLEEGGADTSWTDEEGNKITLQDILDLTKAIPQKDYPTEKLAKIVLNWDDNPEEIERINQVEVSKQYPILIMVDENNNIQWILDGNHRAQKALRSKTETIPAKLIKPSDLNSKAKKILLGITETKLNEAEYQGRKVPLNMPMLEENSIEEVKLTSAGVMDMVRRVFKDPKLLKFLTFNSFKDFLAFIKGGSLDDYYDVKNDIEQYDQQLAEGILTEAEYQGRKVQLGKPMQGDVKKFKVYVKNDKGKVVKVNFGFGGKSAKGKRMVIKDKNPKRRAAFRARHNCKNPGPRWKARYWSCKAW
jgi:hypothetical protein